MKPPHLTFGLAAVALLMGPFVRCGAGDHPWNQWLGGPGRELVRPARTSLHAAPRFSVLWRRPLGSGYAGLSVMGSDGVTAMTDGRRDVVVVLDLAEGTERWRHPLGRTKRRGDGAPAGPLSTPAIDGDSVYIQALDGTFLCLDRTDGSVRWEIPLRRSFGAYEPGYGFAGSPLLLPEAVILAPARSSRASIVALDRRTGRTLWIAPSKQGTDYASPTMTDSAGVPIVVAQLGDEVLGIRLEDGSQAWSLPGAGGGLWTPSRLEDGSVLIPGGEQSTRVNADGTRRWSAPVFAGAMGPVVEVSGLLVGHHERRLTGVDPGDGRILWQAPSESDGQLLGLGSHLVFVNDRAGTLEIGTVDRTGLRMASRLEIMGSTRMETPLTFSANRLYVRAPGELIALGIADPAESEPDR